MTFLFKFSRYLVAPIIIDWLSLTDFALLDSALCNSAARSKYLQVCSSFPQLVERSLLEKEGGLPLTFTMLYWRLSRGFEDWSGVVTLSDSFLRNIVGLTVVDDWYSFWSCGNESLASLNHCCRYLRRIRVDYCPSDYTSTLCSLLQQCSNLEDLYLGKFLIVEDIVCTVSSSCPALVKFHIDCNFDMKARTLMNLITNCNQLREFHFPGICRLSKSFMASYDLSALSHLLFFIETEFDYLITSVHSNSLTAYRPRFFTQSEFRYYLLNGGGSKLIKLDLSIIFHPAGSFLHLLGANCPNLTDLFMPEDRSTEVYFELTVTSLPNLKVLNVTKLRLFGGASIEALGRHCPNLTDLSVNSVVSNIGTCLPNLHRLFVTCRYLTHISIPVMDDSMLGMIATYCTELEVMHLTSQRISYVAADNLAKRLPNLRELTLDACVVSGVIRTFLSNCFKLTLLSFEEDFRYSDRDLWSCIELCSHLKELRITSYNLHMNGSLIKDIVKRLKNLRRLYVKAYRLYEWDRKWFHRELEVINPDLRISLHYMHWVGDSSVHFELQHYV